MVDTDAFFANINVKGSVVGEPKSHSGLNRVTLRLATFSYGAAFKEDAVKQRREVISIELHEEAANRARLLAHGDVIVITNAQLVSRKWTDKRRQEHIRLTVMVDDFNGLECIHAASVPAYLDNHCTYSCS